MAGLLASYSSAEIALSSATAKTLVQLTAPTNQRLKLRYVVVSFDGTSGTAEPAVIRILRQSTAGTMTAATEISMDGLGSETIQGAVTHTATAEPTAGNVLYSTHGHPQGRHPIYFTADPIIVPGGGRVGVEVTAPAAVNAICSIAWEE